MIQLMSAHCDWLICLLILLIYALFFLFLFLMNVEFQGLTIINKAAINLFVFIFLGTDDSCLHLIFIVVYIF